MYIHLGPANCPGNNIDSNHPEVDSISCGDGLFFILIDHTCAIYWTNKNGALARPQASGARNIKDMSVIGDDRYVSIGNIGARSCDFDQVAGRRCNDRLALDNSIFLFDCVK